MVPVFMTVRMARLLYNPMAGRFPAAPFLERATRALEKFNWRTEVVGGSSDKELIQGARDAVDSECEAVFVVGGDGSVGQVASILAGTKTALGVLPAGTANVWAQELGLPALDWIHWFALEQSAERLASGTIRDVDIGICNNYAFLLWAGAGLDAHIVNSIEPRERGEKAFAIVHYATMALWNSIGWEGVDLVVRSGSQTWEGRFVVAVACNIPAYAGGFMDLAPGAKVDDGLLDFWLLGGSSLRDTLTRVAQIFMGTHVEAPGVVHFRASKAVFETEEDLPMQCDGEPRPFKSPIQFQVSKKALKVLVPSGITGRAFS
jgi:YegS/Rv2252/BmrU family lipid kinase